MRDGGILVLGNECKANVWDAVSRSERTVVLFPTPGQGSRVSKGSFVVVEDDGHSNDATVRSVWTEYEISFTAMAKTVLVSVRMIHSRYKGRWKLRFHLPSGDERELEDMNDVLAARRRESRDLLIEVVV